MRLLAGRLFGSATIASLCFSLLPSILILTTSQNKINQS